MGDSAAQGGPQQTAPTTVSNVSASTPSTLLLLSPSKWAGHGDSRTWSESVFPSLSPEDAASLHSGGNVLWKGGDLKRPPTENTFSNTISTPVFKGPCIPSLLPHCVGTLLVLSLMCPHALVVCRMWLAQNLCVAHFQGHRSQCVLWESTSVLAPLILASVRHPARTVSRGSDSVSGTALSGLL